MEDPKNIPRQQASPTAPFVKLLDLRPSPVNCVNTVFIILEKGLPSKGNESGVPVSIALAADPTAAVHLQLWGAEVDAFQPGDIVRMTNGIFSFQKTNLILRAGKKGRLEKVGEFTMLFTEVPNMSRLQWIQDSLNPKAFVPRSLGNTAHPVAAHTPPSHVVRGPNPS